MREWLIHGRNRVFSVKNRKFQVKNFASVRGAREGRRC